MKKRVSSTLRSIIRGLNSFTRRKTWLISSGKRNLLNPMRRSISKVLSLLVCSIFLCFLSFLCIFSTCGFRYERWWKAHFVETMDPTTTIICTVLCQRSDTKSSICTGRNPGYFFILHWYDLLNISCSFKSKYLDSIHFESSRIGHTLQPTLPFVPFCRPRQRCPFRWTFQSSSWRRFILTRDQCAATTLYGPLSVLATEGMGRREGEFYTC